MAYRFPQLVINSFTAIVGKVGVPVLAAAQCDQSELRRIFLLYVRYVAIFAFPAGAGIAAVSRHIIEVMYTDKWAPAIGPLRILAIALAIRTISFLPGILYKAINRPDILTRLAAFKVPFAVSAFWLGTRWGIEGVALAQLVIVFFALTLDTLMVRRVVQVRIRDMFSALVPASTATALMVLVLLLAELLITMDGVPGLILFTTIGLASYGASLAVVSPSTLQRVNRILLELSGRPHSRSGPVEQLDE